MPTVLEQTKKAVEVIEKYGFQSVIAVSVDNTTNAIPKVHLYEPSELNNFDYIERSKEERGCDTYGEIHVELDGVKVFALIGEEKQLTA